MFRSFFAPFAAHCHRRAYLIAAIVSAFALMSVATFPANATPPPTVLVAASGSNTGSCSTIATACINLLNALSIVPDGGIVRCVGPIDGLAGFTITKGVSIECALGGGGITAQSIQINAPGKKVTISNLTVNCLTTCDFSAGIDIVAAATVALENVKVDSSGTIGIYDHRTGGQTKLFIKDTFVRNSGGAGIVAVSAATGITVLDNVTSENNAYGIAAGKGNNVEINRSVFSGNSVAGVEGDVGSQVTISNSTISHNNIGVQSGSSVRIYDNSISYNNTAFSGTAGTEGLNRYNGNVSMGTAPMPISGAPADVGP
jgi:hypothetical protein